MSGAAALALVTCGGLLIAVECNRPGSIFPGALGLLGLLVGGHRMLHLASPASALWAAGFSMAALLLQWRRTLAGLPGLLGTVLLTAALVAWGRAAGAVPAWFAALCGVSLGGLAAVMLLVAGHARLAKQGIRQAAASTQPTAVRERWGVD